MSTDQLHVQLMQAISWHFDKDAIRPGVVTSSLRSGKIYSSIVRYGSQFSGGKKVVVKSTGSDLKEVLVDLSNQFLATLDNSLKNPIDHLKDLVSDKSKK